MKRLAYSVCAAILLGQAVAMVSRSDRNWPFSTVPMFSKIRVQPEHVLVALFGVTEQGEFPLTRSGVISFRLHRLLAKGLSDSPDPDEEEAE